MLMVYSYSTLNPDCYTNYTPQEEVVDFFQQTVDLFKTIPTYDVTPVCPRWQRLGTDRDIVLGRCRDLPKHHPQLHS